MFRLALPTTFRHLPNFNSVLFSKFWAGNTNILTRVVQVIYFFFNECKQSESFSFANYANNMPVLGIVNAHILPPFSTKNLLFGEKVICRTTDYAPSCVCVHQGCRKLRTKHKSGLCLRLDFRRFLESGLRSCLRGISRRAAGYRAWSLFSFGCFQRLDSKCIFLLTPKDV